MKIKNWMMVIACCSGLFFNLQAAELKMAYDADPLSLDPHEQLSAGTLQLSHLLFDPLIRWKKDYSFEPRLAESWQWVNDKTLRFHLRKEVKFHSGNPLTAEDVRWTFDRLKKSPDFKGVFAAIGIVQVIDNHTVDLITSQVYPLLLNSATYLFVMDSRFYQGQDAQSRSKAALIKGGNTFASTHASGSGPFVVSYREQGIRLEFQRFSEYWDRHSPGNVTKIILTPIKEDPTRVAALLAGDIDFISPVPPADHRRIRKNNRIDLITMSGTRIITLQLNQQRQPAFKDQRVRQAIVHAINNQGIVKKIMKGFGLAAGQQSPPGYVGHHPSLTPRYDLKKAKNLMQAAGLDKGLQVTMMAPNNRYVNDEKIAQAVVSMLAKINIRVALKTMPKAQYWPEFDKRAADIMMIGWHSDTEDSANFTEFLTACPDSVTGWGQYNSGHYCNPEVDQLVRLAGVESDSQKRAKLLQQVEQILYDEAAFVPLHWQNLAWAAVKNVKISPILNVMNFPFLGDLVIE